MIRFYGQRLIRLSQLQISPVKVEDTLQEVVLVQLNRDDEMGLNIHELGNPAHNETEDRSSNLDQHFRADIQVSQFMVIQQLPKSSGPSEFSKQLFEQEVNCLSYNKCLGLLRENFGLLHRIQTEIVPFCPIILKDYGTKEAICQRQNPKLYLQLSADVMTVSVSLDSQSQRPDTQIMQHNMYFLSTACKTTNSADCIRLGQCSYCRCH